MINRVAALPVTLLPLTVAAQDCSETRSRTAAIFKSVAQRGDARVDLPVDETGWHLTSEPHAHGWHMRLRDGPDSGRAHNGVCSRSIGC